MTINSTTACGYSPPPLAGASNAAQPAISPTSGSPAASAIGPMTLDSTASGMNRLGQIVPDLAVKLANLQNAQDATATSGVAMPSQSAEAAPAITSATAAIAAGPQRVGGPQYPAQPVGIGLPISASADGPQRVGGPRYPAQPVG